MSALTQRFVMFSPEQRKALVPLLDGMFDTLHQSIITLHGLLPERRSFGDADFSLEPSTPIEDFEPRRQACPLRLIDWSASWQAVLEAGTNLHGQKYLRVFAASKWEIPAEVHWDDLRTKALLGESKVFIDARGPYGDDPDRGWFDHIPIINFSWPLSFNLQLALAEIQGTKPVW